MDNKKNTDLLALKGFLTIPSGSFVHPRAIKGFELALNFHESVDAYQLQDFSGAAISKHTEEEPDNIAKRYADHWLSLIHCTKRQLVQVISA